MIKPGIHSQRQLPSPLRLGWWASRRTVAVALYEEIAGSDRPDRDAALEWILLQCPTATGTLKRTHRHRFPEFDRRSVEAVRNHLVGASPLRVHDLAVSDGRTSCDLYRRLVAERPGGVEFLATDLMPEVILVTDPERGLTVALDEAHRPLQVCRPPFVLNAARRENPLLYPLNALARRWLMGRALPRLLERFHRGDRGLVRRRVPLLHPDLLRLVEEEDGVRFERYDLMQPMPRSFHVVRAMNVLIHDYFSPSELHAALGHIHASLLEGGLFIVGKNLSPESPVDGNIFRRERDRLVSLEESGRGADVRDLIREARWPPRGNADGPTGPRLSEGSGPERT